MIFLFVLSLIGCNEKEVNQPNSGENNNKIQLAGKTVLSVTVSRVGENINDVKQPHISYNQENSIELQTFVHAIHRAKQKQINGVVDVRTPNYLLTLTYEDVPNSKFLLWLGDDGGSIMNKNDTLTMFTLPSDLIVDLNKYVK